MKTITYEDLDEDLQCCIAGIKDEPFDCVFEDFDDFYIVAFSGYLMKDAIEILAQEERFVELNMINSILSLTFEKERVDE